jgi:hypothetical protein
MTPHARQLAAIAAALSLTLAACASTPDRVPGTVTTVSPTPVEPPVATPSPVAVPPASASVAAFTCDDGTTGCAGDLTAGVHSSSNFTIPLQITVPDGWVNVRDIARTYEVEPSSSSGVPGHPDIEVLAMNAIADPASCGPVPLAGAGSSVQDFIDYVGGHRGLEATAPAPATIDGYHGQSIDFSVRSDWTAMCPDIDPDNPVVLMLTSTNTDPPGRHLAYRQGVRIRWTVLDVAGETVIVGAVVPATQDAAAMAEIQRVVDSLDFTPRT